MRGGLGLATDGSGLKARSCQDRVIKASRLAPEVKTHTHLPMPLNGTELAADRPLAYYTTSANLDTEGHMVPFRPHLSILANIFCLSSIVESTMEEINRIHKDQL